MDYTICMSTSFIIMCIYSSVFCHESRVVWHFVFVIYL